MSSCRGRRASCPPTGPPPQPSPKTFPTPDRTAPRGSPRPGDRRPNRRHPNRRRAGTSVRQTGSRSGPRATAAHPAGELLDQVIEPMPCPESAHCTVFRQDVRGSSKTVGRPGPASSGALHQHYERHHADALRRCTRSSRLATWWRRTPPSYMYCDHQDAPLTHWRSTLAPNIQSRAYRPPPSPTRPGDPPFFRSNGEIPGKIRPSEPGDVHRNQDSPGHYPCIEALGSCVLPSQNTETPSYRGT